MGTNTPCASCKLLRRRCGKDCIFAPYFPSHELHKFAIVHKVFGASNVSKMLLELPVHQRPDAVSSLVYEATARVRDPVYGCVGAIWHLQNQVSQLQMQLVVAQAEILWIQTKREEAAAAVLLPQNGSEPYGNERALAHLHGESIIELPHELIVEDFGSDSSNYVSVQRVPLSTI
ncbi:hypothetical protein SAY87_025975 [Trapa incisa]|uniref:LOB domain-containing protein n=1 Tax=Trapa incisa TaxID=236973 RepID=A0AAN7GLE1_9MYRT|nr:hypothetical protein SAY87_025975 [Trapa incisa]